MSSQATLPIHPPAMGQPYSAANKVPSVAEFLKRQDDLTLQQQQHLPVPVATHGAADRDQHQEKVDGAAGSQEEKDEIMKKAMKKDSNPAKELELKGKRMVVDPITGMDAVIVDDDHSENRAGNVLLHPFPPALDNPALAVITGAIDRYSYILVAALLPISYLVSLNRGWLSFVVILLASAAIYTSHQLVSTKLVNELESMRLDLHKQRGQLYSHPTPESCEWLNALVECIWERLNPDLFISLVDMIEDVLQQSLPSFVDAVKVSDFTLGRNALRIVSMRGLPDRVGDREYPREEWIDGRKKDRGQDSNDDDDAQSGSYVNMEVAFAYSVPPKKEKGEKKTALANRNISLLLEFFLGAYDWLHVPVPIWISVERICGTARIRAQIISDPPCVRNVTITLMGVPSIEASAIPLTRFLPNVLDLPFVSSLVKSSIAAATTPYVAPRSLTLNVQQILAGDGVKKDTLALGVLKVTIRHASNLSAQDSNGTSDPYVVLSFAKFGKPLYSTRIIPRELNPVWNETTFLLVSADEIKSNEQLSVQLWDSDRYSADDLVGRIANIPLSSLMLHPGEDFDREDALLGYEDGDSMSGMLSWSIGYYDKAKLDGELKKEKNVDHNLPEELRDRPELKVETKAADTPEESDVLRTPPSPFYPSGVLSIIVHYISSLERQNLSPGATGPDREGQAGQDTDQSEESAELPSAYCELIVNDDMIYKTRVKQYNPMPFFEAGTEVFSRDWRKCIVRVVVRDSRLREHDPILGIVSLPLAEVFANSSQHTGLYALENGVGYGRISISTLWKGVKMQLPREMLGWDTGTIEVTDHCKVEAVGTFEFGERRLTVSTIEAKQKLPGSLATKRDDGVLEWEVSNTIRLPTYDRYASALFFDYGAGKVLGIGSDVKAFAVLWLRDLIDGEEKKVRLPIITSNNISSLRHNYINEQTDRSHAYDIVGYLTTTVRLDPGLDEDHESYSKSQTELHEFESWDRVLGQSKQSEVNSHAMDDGVIDKEEQRAIDKAHQKALYARHRGVMQYKAVRTAKWSKDGLKSRVKALKNAITGSGKEEKVDSEGKA